MRENRAACLVRHLSTGVFCSFLAFFSGGHLCSKRWRIRSTTVEVLPFCPAAVVVVFAEEKDPDTRNGT